MFDLPDRVSEEVPKHTITVADSKASVIDKSSSQGFYGALVNWNAPTCGVKLTTVLNPGDCFFFASRFKEKHYTTLQTATARGVDIFQRRISFNISSDSSFQDPLSPSGSPSIANPYGVPDDMMPRPAFVTFSFGRYISITENGTPSTENNLLDDFGFTVLAKLPEVSVDWGSRRRSGEIDSDISMVMNGSPYDYCVPLR